MQSAETIDDIHRQLNYTKKKFVMMVFAPFNNETSGHVYDFLCKAVDYNYHSGQFLDIFCIGYSIYEPEPNKNNGIFIDLKDKFNSPLSYFYIELFHEIRRYVSLKTNSKWNYRGGVDIVLASTHTLNNVIDIDWSRFAVVSSRKVVGAALQDVDEMMRVIINTSEYIGGDIYPEYLSSEINSIRFTSAISRMFGANLGGMLGKLIGFFGA